MHEYQCGTYFGEISLLTKHVRQAWVRASAPAAARRRSRSRNARNFNAESVPREPDPRYCQYGTVYYLQVLAEFSDFSVACSVTCSVGICEFLLRTRF